MEKQTKKYIVKQNKIFKTRKIYSVDSSLVSLLMSKFLDDYVTSFDNNLSFQTHCSDYFTKDAKLIRGSIDVTYEVLDPLKYSYEALTKRVLDIITRTILASYFEKYNLDELDKTDDEFVIDANNIVALINNYVKKYIPYVKVTNISSISDFIYKSKNCRNLDLIKGKQNDSTNYDINDLDEKGPLAYYAEDDLKCKRVYNRKMFVAENEVLYYVGKISKPGTYYGKKARGNIIAKGKHAYSPAAQTYEDENGHLVNVYPNFLYEVTDLNKYLTYYSKIRNIFNVLASQIVQYSYSSKDYIKDMNTIYSNYNEYVCESIEDIERFGIKLEYITYTMKNPKVDKSKVRKKDETGYSYIELKK